MNPSSAGRQKLELRHTLQIRGFEHPGYGVSSCPSDGSIFTTPTPSGELYEDQLVELRPSPNKGGVGVFAKRDIGPKQILLYYGKIHLTKDDVETFYTVELRLSGVKRAQTASPIIPKGVKMFVDGQPELTDMYDLKLKYASRVNEPGPGERVNCAMHQLESRDAVFSEKKRVSHRSNPYVRVAYMQPLAPIRAGEEILVCYGGSYYRLYDTPCAPPARLHTGAAAEEERKDGGDILSLAEENSVLNFIVSQKMSVYNGRLNPPAPSPDAPSAPSASSLLPARGALQRL